MHADDIQLCLDFSPEDEDSAHAIIVECVKEIKTWLSDNFLLLNENNTESITVIPVNQSAVAKSIQLGDVIIPLSSYRLASQTLVQYLTESVKWK